jgi:hypothetical protein
MPPLSLNIQLESVLIDKLHIAIVENLRTDYPMIAQNLVMEKIPCQFAGYVSYAFTSFLANIHRQDKETATLYEYPATAWDFIKEKYAPKWFLKRWPVRYESKKIVTWRESNFMCPHLPTEPTYPHALWLKKNQDTSWWQ